MYNIEVKPKCQESIDKLCKKNPVLEKALKNKMNQILENPDHYKPLKYDFAGIRRVHIMKSFVLEFEIDKAIRTVKFTLFKHHDEAYKR